MIRETEQLISAINRMKEKNNTKKEKSGKPEALKKYMTVL